MCGIAGFTGQCNTEILEAFQGALHHRGPDERGALCNLEIGLSHNRLSIIDLVSGQQPMFNEDRSCAIVFNGEIYNYRELRRELWARHDFRTESDTEVILHLYEEQGIRTSEQLKGDFAFCIWDSRRQQCYLSRDPLGVKPLFCTVTNGGHLVFSSELTCLLQHPEVHAELDLDAVAEYLYCLYISAPRSLIRGIWKLCPGESLLWKDGALEKWRYWHVPAISAIQPTAEAHKAKVRELLQQAISRRLIADVPVGAFLSGGLDSSLIVAMACRETSKLQTFSVGYGEPDFDELKFARQVSRHCGTDHHEFVVKPDARLLLEEVIAAMDEPIADSSAIPTFLVARETSKYVKVALSGVGGDELFFGYPRYLGAKLSQHVPQSAAVVLAVLARLFSSRPTGRDITGWIRRFGQGLLLAPWPRYWYWTTFLDHGVQKALLPSCSSDNYRFMEDARETFTASNGDYLDRVFRVDMSRYLPSDLLKFGDAMTMANSLELRVPFCDSDLLIEVARTSAAVRFPGFRLKSQLRELARDYLPPEILARRKQGFMIPIGRWFRQELRNYLEFELSRERLPHFLEPTVVQALIREHVSSRVNHTHLLWGILVLTRWLQLHPQIKTVSYRDETLNI